MKNILPLFHYIILLFLLPFLFVSCVSRTVHASTLNIMGATDVIHIAEAVKEDFQKSSGIRLNAIPSRDALKDLQTGKADVILVGRELTAVELQGIESETVAYDAVCVLISYRAFEGGIEQGSVGGLIQPNSKFEGLKNLQLNDLKGHYGNILNILTGDNFWNLPMGYFTFQPYLVDDTLQVKENTDNPGHALGTWVWNFAPLGGELTSPGLTDAQLLLLQKLGYGKVNLKAPNIGFAPQNIGSEEEWISSRYDLMPEDANSISSMSFNFYLMPVSRQVTVRALQHNFAIRVLSIDNVDPLANPKAIYDGSYPLGRKIYVLAKQPVSADNEKLIQYFVSGQGQMEIEKANYLPLPK